MLTYDAIADDPLLGSSALTNTATVVGSSLTGPPTGERDALSPNGGPGSGYQASTTSTLTAPQLAITKSVSPTTATVGETLTYTLEATIPAGIILYDVSVVDQLPTGMVFDTTTATSCDEGGSACSPDPVVTAVGPSGNDVAWFLGDLTTPAAGDRVVTIVYDAYPGDVAAVSGGATLTNTAGAYGNQTDTIVGIPAGPPPPASFDVASPTDSADVAIVEPTLTINKDVAGQAGDTDTRRAKPGETLSYTVTVTNGGSGPAYDVDVSDITDPRLLPISVVDGSGYVVTDGDPSDGTLAWTIAGPMAPLSSVTITYDVQVPAGLDESDEVAGPELTNTADVPHYYGVDPTAQLPARTYRDYNDVAPDTVTIELDLASIGDRLWYDVNKDGVQGPLEPSIVGADVIVTFLGPDLTLGTLDDEVFSSTTGAGGLYLADQLPGGSYHVAVVTGTLPPGMTASFDLDDGIVGPDDEWLGTLAEAEAKRDIDFGYTGAGSIGDAIWLDRNSDGVFDLDEPGLGGVDLTVTWLGFDGTAGGGDDLSFPVTTAIDGSYLVSDLPAGTYTVTVNPATLPNGVTQVSDPDVVLDDSTTVTLGAGIDHVDADFGYRGDGSIGDFVWLDLDGNGAADAGDPGIEGLTVELTWFGPDGAPAGGDDFLFQTVTDASGGYLFDGLPEGSYQVDVVGGLPALVTNSYDEDGDSDSSAPVALGAGVDHDTADFGYFGSTLIGDRVWWDINQDGVQDPTEPGLGGVEVTVTYAGADATFGTGDDLVFVTTTSVDGDYIVETLPGGDYRIEVTDGIAAGFFLTFDEDDATAGPDGISNVSGLGVGAHLTADFGYASDGSLGDYVWFDRNGDGLQDADEPGLAGATVELTWYGPDGAAGGGDDITFETVTDLSGAYVFDGLPAGNFGVIVDATTLPAGMSATYDLDGTFDGTTIVSLAVSEVRTDADFGYTGSGQIGDTVWLDLDGDSVSGPAEPGLEGVDMTLWWAGPDNLFLTGDDATFSETTGAGGLYNFTGLPAGQYRVYADVTDLPAGLTATYDEDGSLDSTALVSLSPGGIHPTADFGYRGSASVGDTVWIDLNGDGVLDPGESGLSGVTLGVTSPGFDGVLGTLDDIPLTVTTDAAGVYQISGLPSGATEVSIDETLLPGGLTVAADLDGGDPTMTTVLLNPGDDILNVDYPLIGAASLDGIVWEDTNGDAIIDPGEAGIPGVTVIIVWDGPGGPVEITVVSDPAGEWAIANIPAGDYTATVDETTVPSDLYPSTPTSKALTVPPGGSASVEHGLAPPVWIEGSVWLDSDGDGVFGPGEAGIAGVIANLYDDGGNLVASTATDSDGGYLFSELPPGTYTVTLDLASLPEGVVPVFDPDLALDLQTTVTVAAGGAILNANFGFIAPAALPATGAELGGLAWLAAALVAAGILLVGFVRRKVTAT